MKARLLYSRVGVEADIESLEESRQATAAVLRALRDRLTPEQADQAVAQLPRDGGLRSLTQAEMVTDAVIAGLKEQLSPGEADDIVAQLPGDLKTLWVRA
jgi:uncharacterized protein (DUF2267 family)